MITNAKYWIPLMPLTPQRRAYLMALITAIIWSFAFVCIRELLEELEGKGVSHELSALALFQGRIAITTLCFLPHLFRESRHIKTFTRRDWIFTLLVSITMTFGYHMPLNYGAHHLPSGFVGLLISLGPLFGAILAHFFLKERLGIARFFAIILGFFGVALCLWAQNRLNTFSFSDITSLTGPLLLIFAAFDGSIFALLGRRLRKDIPVSVKLGLAMVFATLIGLPLWNQSLLQALASLEWKGWIALLYLSVPSMYLASLLWYASLRVLTAVQVMIYLNVMTLLSLLWGAILFKEQLRPLYLLGAFCVIAAVFLTSLSPRTSKES